MPEIDLKIPRERRLSNLIPRPTLLPHSFSLALVDILYLRGLRFPRCPVLACVYPWL